MENRCYVLIDDETELNGSYDFRYRPADGFAFIRKQIANELGIELTLEKRKTRIIEITFRSSTVEEPGMQAEDNASDGS